MNPASDAEAATVKPKGTNTLFHNGVCTFPISGNPTFINTHGVYQGYLLTAVFWIDKSLVTLYPLISYS